jgi:hypothetical protein
MAVTTEPTTPHHTRDELRENVTTVRERHGDITAVTRPLGDVERLDPDASGARRFCAAARGVDSGGE